MTAVIDISLLVKPLTDLLASFGTGVLTASGPADSLRATSTAVDQVHAAGRDSINNMSSAWDGVAADAATSKALRVQTSAATISDRGNDMATIVGQAATEIESGKKELTTIVQSFVDDATKLAPTLTTPAGLSLLVGSAIDHIQQGVKVVGKVQSELSTHTTAMSELTPPPSTSLASTVASGVQSAASSVSSSGLQQLVSTGTGLLGTGTSALSGLMKTASTSTVPASTTSAGTPTKTDSPTTKTDTGQGVKIKLPDGSEVTAPNEKAATAVRTALKAVGTPYVWGGNTPGVGLDCSGLTKSSYEAAGIELPRLADQQAVGSRVSPGDLMPGDLAVWDGHVAMVVGNGKMIEAGDPVSITAIRTENIGMQFNGFYRPTA